MARKILLAAGLLIAGAVVVLYALGSGIRGSHEEPGEIAEVPRPDAVNTSTDAAVVHAADGIGVSRPKQVLFGDFHVHTTFSFDAFMLSMPLAGEGAHPPADACDFARYCSALDFWSINDHAEQITQPHWRETIDTIRQCNDLSGNASNPDMVSFLGWEWTQVGDTPDDHYGHKNVVLASLEEDEIPTRPIAAGATVRRVGPAMPGTFARGMLSLIADDKRYQDLVKFFAERDGLALCDKDTNVHDLPTDCLEYTDTPAELYRKLDEWGFDSIVIPHGTTWGMYTPPASTWDKQLAGDMHDPDRQTLIEVYSGHGDSEVYRDWRALDLDADGSATCPEPRPDYLPTCWRAGEIIRERCLAEGEDAEECEERAVDARRLAAEAGHQAFLTVPGAEIGEWLDSGQCRDCDEPSFNYRPGGSAQYVMALGNFDDDPENPRRFRFGFMASSDNHFARPGTGYKERYRRGNTESGRLDAGTGPENPMARFFTRPAEEKVSRSRSFDRDDTDVAGFQLFEIERQASFFTTGGLIAVHSAGRDRDAIWSSLDRREIYGTSGPRILLWFDLLNSPGTRGGSLPMGSETRMRQGPIFQVRAVGSFEQKPGCPDYAVRGLDGDKLERLCKNDCYNPSDERRLITRIDVVRIRPQIREGEPVANLVDDPWRSFECSPDPAGCAITFQDPDFEGVGRDTVYYARVFEEPKPGINAGNLRCEYDDAGNCVRVHPCPGPEGAADDCLEQHEPRAWSSPIFVDYGDGSG
jgi:hypothetical protein